MKDKLLPLAGIIVGSAVLAGAIAPKANAAMIGGHVLDYTDYHHFVSIKQDHLGNNSQYYTVNKNNFFGHNNWEFHHKMDFEDGQGENGIFSVKPGTHMYVFKSAQEGLKAYLFKDVKQAHDIEWLNPFDKDLSHMTHYRLNKETPKAVPEPLTILGTMFAGGFGYVMKRKNKSAD